MSTPEDPYAPPPSEPPTGGPPPGQPGPPPGYGAPPPPGYGPPPGYAAPPPYGTQPPPYGAQPPPYGSPPGYPPAPGYGTAPGWGQPQWQQGPTTSTKAVVAFVMAVGSFVVCPLIPAIVALVLAPQARSEIYASGGRVGGDGLVTAARIIAWVNIGLCLLVIAAIALLVGVGVSTSEISDTVVTTPG